MSHKYLTTDRSPPTQGGGNVWECVCVYVWVGVPTCPQRTVERPLEEEHLGTFDES